MGILGILVLVVAVSGCSSNSSNEKLIMQYNIPANVSDANSILNVTIPTYFEQNVTLPNGTKSVRVEYQNISVSDTGQENAILDVMFLDAVPGPVDSQYYSAFDKQPYSVFETQHSLNSEMVSLNSTSQVLSGNITFSNNPLNDILLNKHLEGLVINHESVKGTIRVYATT